MNRNARLNRSGFKPRRKRCLKECVFSRTEKLKQSGFSPLRCANMNEHRRQILQMLAEGKISADEAERLIAALETPSSYSTSPDSASISTRKPRPRYLRVLVDAEEGSSGYDGPTRVNVRVPMQLLRAGVRLAGLIPAQALHRANQAMHEKGVPIDLSQIKPENLEELVEQLSDLTVDVDQKDAGAKVKVRVFCE